MSNLLSNRKFLVGYPVFWLLWSGMQTGVLIRLGLRSEIALADSVLSNALLALAGVAVSHSLRYSRPGKKKYAYIFIWSLGMTGVCCALQHVSLYFLFRAEPGYPEFLDKSMPVRAWLAFLMTGWMAMMSWIWYNQEEQQENEQRKTQAERLAREAELFRLRQQLQPHFLFNSLNSISALAGSRPEEARKMVQQLSDFLRSTLTREEQQYLTLEEELQHLQLYLSIEEVRFGHRLNICMENDELSLVCKVPCLLLQPIVENAIKFGLYDTTEEVTIHIGSVVDKDELILTVRNPFDPDTATPKNGAG
ncbi:MAG TPA: histidine kinase, partial [Bacteroidia bacterium]|nr:histidine kinase [Bacteroidia bacterium]